MATEAVKHIMATVFAAQNALRELAPEYKWAGMGNLLGDYGEYMCVGMYNLTKAPAGASGYDAVTQDGSTVQIKANHSSSTIGFRGTADLLLVVKVSEKVISGRCTTALSMSCSRTLVAQNAITNGRSLLQSYGSWRRRKKLGDS